MGIMTYLVLCQISEYFLFYSSSGAFVIKILTTSQYPVGSPLTSSTLGITFARWRMYLQNKNDELKVKQHS